VLLLDVTRGFLSARNFRRLDDVIIPRNSTIPSKPANSLPRQSIIKRSMPHYVLQGERERACDNWSLVNFDIDLNLPLAASHVAPSNRTRSIF